MSQNRDLPAHKLEEHADAPRIVEVVKYREVVEERPRQEAHWRPDLQLLAKLQDSTFIRRANQSLDYSTRYGMGSVPSHY